MARRCRCLLPVALLALLLTACGGDDAAQAWRGATLAVPEDWTVFEEADTRLSMANVALGEEADFSEENRPEGDIIAMFFTHEDGTTPDRWRSFVEEREESELEVDEAIEVDGVPATRLIYTHRSSGEPTREMVVVVPARDIEILVQPVPGQGSDEGPEMFERHRDTVEGVLDSIEWGAPVEEPG